MFPFDESITSFFSMYNRNFFIYLSCLPPFPSFNNKTDKFKITLRMNFNEACKSQSFGSHHNISHGSKSIGHISTGITFQSKKKSKVKKEQENEQTKKKKTKIKKNIKVSPSGKFFFLARNLRINARNERIFASVVQSILLEIRKLLKR